MTNETELPPGRQASARGCLTLAAIFLVFTVGGTFATLVVYTLMVEQWGLEVPRDFGYEMILYAPMAGLACGFAAVFWSMRGDPSARRAPVWLGLGLTVALGLVAYFAPGMLF